MRDNCSNVPADPDINHDPIFYSGPSMYPTLKVKDLLHVVPYGDREIRPGDVIVFRPPGSRKTVVHRIVSVDPQGGIRTRGDNNPDPDPWVLSPQDIQGRVVLISNRGKTRNSRGGSRGRVAGRLMCFRRVLRQQVYARFRPLYRWLAATGLVRGLVPVPIRTKVISFRRPDGSSELHLLIGNRVAGRLLPGDDTWQIDPPFRLLVDESSLPRSAEPH